ncbi:MAG: hypothetical protein IKF82_00465 [Bacilli bacterium]|nr:hypothetical protein [Bacilli bacterium]
MKTIKKTHLIEAINECKHLDDIIQEKIDEALDNIRDEYNIWINYSWDYKE